MVNIQEGDLFTKPYLYFNNIHTQLNYQFNDLTLIRLNHSHKGDKPFITH